MKRLLFQDYESLYCSQDGSYSVPSYLPLLELNRQQFARHMGAHYLLDLGDVLLGPNAPDYLLPDHFD